MRSSKLTGDLFFKSSDPATMRVPLCDLTFSSTVSLQSAFERR